MTPQPTPEQKAAYEAILAEACTSVPAWSDNRLASVIQAMHTVHTSQQAEIDRLQAKITQLAGIILDYESKWDILAENEGKRMVEFGEALKEECALGVISPIIRSHIKGIDIKKLFNNLRKMESNRKPHLINLEALQQWMLENESVFATDGNKRLVVTMVGSFKLYYNREIFWQGTQPFTAVEKYNSL